MKSTICGTSGARAGLGRVMINTGMKLKEGKVPGTAESPWPDREGNSQVEHARRN